MTTYTRSTEHPDTILRDDGVYIPMDDGNRDYMEYLRWIEEGNTPVVKPILVESDNTFGDTPWQF